MCFFDMGDGLGLNNIRAWILQSIDFYESYVSTLQFMAVSFCYIWDVSICSCLIGFLLLPFTVFKGTVA
jgi:hypothetical protein